MSEQTKPTYVLNLSNGSTTLLRHLINQPGWTKTVSAFMIGAELIANIIPEPPEQPDRPHPALAKNYASELEQWKKDNEVWSKGSVEAFTLTEKQRDNVKDCLKHAVENKVTIPSKPAFDLFTAFGLTE